ncbi:MAG: hypothetical protein E6Q97_33490 [Desulfurellales bacterium]|nr:MAG: hypothetical protein E6Q97_33490 [Desulfurellales bacterium]
MAMTLEELGITKEELAERVVDRITDQLLRGYEFDEEGNEGPRASSFNQTLQKQIKELIDAKVAALAEQHVLPKVGDFIENLTLQETNKWGEKTGQTLTFIEYLVQRADAYMREEVDRNGKSKSEDSYSWSRHSTRLSYAIDSHLQHHMESAMRKALADANASIAGGITAAVKLSLEQILINLKVGVQVGR